MSYTNLNVVIGYQENKLGQQPFLKATNDTINYNCLSKTDKNHT